jgi:hypothetical protein
MPQVNERLYKAIRGTVQDALLATPEAQALQDLNNLVHDKLHGQLDKATLDKIENLFYETQNLIGDEMFAAGFAIGRNPDLIFDLPEASACWSV